MTVMIRLDGKVAVVDDGGGAVGRAVALALAARGAKVVVSGPGPERSLGETVGEIAYGGGKARHVVGDPTAAAARAAEVFGPVDIVVATRADCTLPPAARTIVLSGDVDSDEIGATVADLCSPALKARTIRIEA